MYVYMGHMKYEHTKPYQDGFWAKNRLELVQKHVAQVVTARQELLFADGSTLTYDQLVIASGSRPNRLAGPATTCPACRGSTASRTSSGSKPAPRKSNRPWWWAAGLIGIELAEMLHSRRIPVTFLVRERHFWGSVLPAEEAQMIGRHIREHHIDLRLQTELARSKATLPTACKRW
jgi:NADPH-dependent 2,4-dienoyl-CoA reductase/sulfur reductase-like enzyme